MNVDSFINRFNNHPVLFIGAGFSLRYLEHSYTWEGLLKHISYELTGNNETFLDLKSKSQNSDGTFSYEEIASDIESLFNNTLSQDRDGKFKEINDVFYDNMENGINLSRFKIYISKLQDDLSIKKDKQAEITALKKVRKNIGSTITTNYDELIEDLFEFSPLVGNDILLSNPYGSVYKIHGCVTNPDKIIITNEDYTLFDKKYELIRAQLLSLFIHNPIIFIGYNIGDDNIRKLLKTVFTYVPPNSEVAQKIKSNFLVVEYDKGSTNLEVHDYDIVLEDMVTIRVNKIKTDNFIEIYNSIASIQLPVSAMDIRKVQSVVKDIYEGGNIQVSIVDDVNKLKNDEKVLAIGSINRISYDFQTAGELMENYFKIIEEDNFQLLQLIDKYTIQKEQFFPIFAFSKINNKIKCTEKLKEQQKTKLRNNLERIPENQQISDTTIEQILQNDNVPQSSKSNAILYAILKNQLDNSDIETYLIE
ncbi:SIR2 family protein, partial [Listeria monocytogenes]|nr:SIR2 family protein [Listeria monocytogenes]